MICFQEKPFHKRSIMNEIAQRHLEDPSNSYNRVMTQLDKVFASVPYVMTVTIGIGVAEEECYAAYPYKYKSFSK